MRALGQPAKDRESIPTVLALVDKPEIIQEAAAGAAPSYANELQEVNLSPGATPEQRLPCGPDWMGCGSVWAEEQAADVLARYDEARSRRQLSQHQPSLPRCAASATVTSHTI